MSKKISDIYNIDNEILEELAESNDYWEKCSKFFKEVKDKFIDELTAKQIDWLDRISNEYITQWERLC